MIVIHKKTGDYYNIIYSDHFIKNCTNEQDGQRMIMYKKINDYSNLLFVREEKEFKEKFEVYIPDEKQNGFVTEEDKKMIKEFYSES
jgi:hypothetical protein